MRRGEKQRPGQVMGEVAGPELRWQRGELPWKLLGGFSLLDCEGCTGLSLSAPLTPLLGT